QKGTNRRRRSGLKPDLVRRAEAKRNRIGCSPSERVIWISRFCFLLHCRTGCRRITWPASSRNWCVVWTCRRSTAIETARWARESSVSPGDDGSGAVVWLLRRGDGFAADRTCQLRRHSLSLSLRGPASGSRQHSLVRQAAPAGSGADAGAGGTEYGSQTGGRNRRHGLLQRGAVNRQAGRRHRVVCGYRETEARRGRTIKRSLRACGRISFGKRENETEIENRSG